MKFYNDWAKWGCLLVRLAVVCTLSTLLATRVQADNIVGGHVLVRVAPGVDIKALATSYKTTVQEQLPGTTLYSLVTPKGVNETQFATQLTKDSRVVYAEPDTTIISPEVGGAPFHLAFDRSKVSATYVNSVNYTQVHLGQTDALSQINGKAPLATGAGIIVAVLDTGATYTHPDLVGHYLPGYNVLAPNTLPWDVADGVLNYEVGHGTMVAGIIARVAPKATILPIRVLNGDGSGTLFNLVKGIHYANTHGARVLNMSFNCSVKSGALNDALDESETMGVMLIASAGNDNLEQGVLPAVSHGSIAVGAVEANNTKSPYSNYGSFVRVVAPGSNIRSTFVDGGYATWSGTSFAAPFVSAEVALVLSVSPSLTGDKIKSCIRNTAHSVDKANTKAYQGKLGNGVIDIEAAVKSVKP
ncbi:MAG: putative serine protease [Chthonomonadales bacterium]|nr:putative serine protease [Chthonomonadales bacterium]